MPDKDPPIQVGSSVPFDVTLLDKDENPLDISSATVRQIHIKSPIESQAAMVKPAAFKTNGSDGVITFTTIPSDLSVRGDWKIQGEVTTPTWSAKSEIGYFEVEDNLS